MTGPRRHLGSQAWPGGVHLLTMGLVIAASYSTLAAASDNKVGEFKIEGGWNEVKKGWPIDDTDYFISTEKGHHYIEAQLPKDLKQDLMVSFEYYYSYAKTRPVLQMTPCRQNIYLVDEKTEDHSNSWVKHTHRVSHSDCNARNELAYNALLHDSGDVFAWRKIEIEFVPSEPTRDVPPEKDLNDDQESSEKPNFDALDEALDEPKGDDTEIVKPGPEKPTDAKTIDESKSIKPSDKAEPKPDEKVPDAEPTNKDPVKETVDEPMKETTKESQPSDSVKDSTKDPVSSGSVKDATRDPEPSGTIEDSTKDPKPSGTIKETTPEIKTEPKKQSKSESEEEPVREPAKEPIKKRDDGPYDPILDAAEDRADDHAIARQIVRHKRDLTTMARSKDKSKEPTKVPMKATCKPSSCNRQLFHMSRFSGLIHGLPKVPEDKMGLKYFVNMKNQPLKLKFKSYDVPLEEVDSCVEFSLYMEKDTEFEFLLENSPDSREARLLEVVKRKLGDSTESQWDEFKRCISDYMPRYTAGKKSNNALKFVLRPRGAPKAGQMAVLIDQKRASSFRNLYPTQSFLPDLQRMSDSNQMQKFWVLDRDGLNKPKLELVQNGANKVLHVSQIDPTQASFDITSRWLQIKDAEILEQPILFNYKAERVDWIERVDFEYQRANDAADDWLTQTAWEAKDQKTEGQTAAASSSGSEAAKADQAESSSAGQEEASQSLRMINLPISLKGADSSEFRIRLRHHLKQKANRANQVVPGVQPSGDLSLAIRSLAFADVCAYSRPYCQNNGKCKPSGATKAECICDPGFSGLFCEHIRPCDVLYGPGEDDALLSSLGLGQQQVRMTGHQMCKSLGSQCIDQLPVMRCEWPSDKYYQCKKLFKLDATTDKYVPISGLPSTSTGNSSQAPGSDSGEPSQAEPEERPTESLDDLEPEEQVRRLKELNNQQAKLIIILGVFLVALAVFAVVLIGSMVSRLRVSSGRLRKSQSEVHELSRRSQPGASGGFQQAHGSGMRRGQIGYNNSAFDVDL